MNKKDFIKKILAGLFFIVGIIIICTFVLVIGIQKGLMESKFQMTLLFKNVGGLSVGAPVLLSGVHVGTVGGIDFLDEPINGREVKVILNLFAKYKKQLAKSGRFAIKTEGILGEKTIEISSTGEAKQTDLTQPIIGEDPLDVQELAELFGEAAVAMLETSRVVGSTISQLHDTSNSIKRLFLRIEQRIIDGDLFKVF